MGWRAAAVAALAMPTLATDGKNEPVTEVVEGVSRRLALARAAIESGRSRARAAAESGFADQSHMTRQFKRTYGLTPGRWTALTAASSPGLRPPIEESDRSQYENLVPRGGVEPPRPCGHRFLRPPNECS
jgi:hypothetical protein